MLTAIFTYLGILVGFITGAAWGTINERNRRGPRHGRPSEPPQC